MLACRSNLTMSYIHHYGKTVETLCWSYSRHFLLALWHFHMPRDVRRFLAKSPVRKESSLLSEIVSGFHLHLCQEHLSENTNKRRGCQATNPIGILWLQFQGGWGVDLWGWICTPSHQSSPTYEMVVNKPLWFIQQPFSELPWFVFRNFEVYRYGWTRGKSIRESNRHSALFVCFTLEYHEKLYPSEHDESWFNGESCFSYPHKV